MEIRQYKWNTRYITSYGIWLTQCSESNLLHKKAEKYDLSVQLKLQREKQNKSIANIKKQDWQSINKQVNKQGDIITHKADIKTWWSYCQ